MEEVDYTLRDYQMFIAGVTTGLVGMFDELGIGNETELLADLLMQRFLNIELWERAKLALDRRGFPPIPEHILAHVEGRQRAC